MEIATELNFCNESHKLVVKIYLNIMYISIMNLCSSFVFWDKFCSSRDTISNSVISNCL